MRKKLKLFVVKAVMLSAFFISAKSVCYCQHKVLDVNYGETICYRNSSPYDYSFDMNTLISKLVKESYFSKPHPQNLSLDIYLPNEIDHRKRPLVVLAHDGAFQIGDKQDKLMTFLASRLANNNMVVASINYGMGFEVSEAKALSAIHNAALNMRGAVRFLLNSKYAKFIDEEAIFVGGASAGAITSLTAAFQDDGEFLEFYRDKVAGQAFFECMDCTTNFDEAQYEIKGVISLWGAVTDLSVIDSCIPTLLIHGVNDDIVPFEYDYPFKSLGMSNKASGRLIFKKMYGASPISKKLGSCATLIDLEGHGHSPHWNRQNNDWNFEIRELIIKSIIYFINS